jgi:hypothetical protein
MGSYVIGDIHGCYERFRELLQSHSLISDDLAWTGGDSKLWLMGDYFDTGNQAIECIELIIRLQQEAAAAGGELHALLGNHDVMIAGAYLLGDTKGSTGHSFLEVWKMWGGQNSDFERLTEAYVNWILSLPAMGRSDDTLLMHTDGTFYCDMGRDVSQVNEEFRRILSTPDPVAWEQLLRNFGQRHAFSGPDGSTVATRFRRHFGVSHLIHAHSPISEVREVPPELVDRAYTYADGQCTNVDHGIGYYPESQNHPCPTFKSPK